VTGSGAVEAASVDEQPNPGARSEDLDVGRGRCERLLHGSAVEINRVEPTVGVNEDGSLVGECDAERTPRLCPLGERRSSHGARRLHREHRDGFRADRREPIAAGAPRDPADLLVVGLTVPKLPARPCIPDGERAELSKRPSASRRAT
jgi:hypothetical protein